jgi:hypothetical protein
LGQRLVGYSIEVINFDDRLGIGGTSCKLAPALAGFGYGTSYKLAPALALKLETSTIGDMFLVGDEL